LIPEFWRSKHKTHKIMESKVACATLWSPYSEDRINLIPQQWPSRPFWSPNFGDQRLRSTRSWDQKWPARHYDPPMLGIKTFWSRICGLRVHFDPRILGIKDLAPQDHGI
jgi:hypothetical protein